MDRVLKAFKIKKIAYNHSFTELPNSLPKNFKNFHPTVKPVQLFSYLITLGSRQGDLILDPFIGSGTAAISARLIGRDFLGFELNRKYHKIAEARIKPFLKQQRIGDFK